MSEKIIDMSYKWNYDGKERIKDQRAPIYNKRKWTMRDICKCFLVGVLCLWLFADAIDVNIPVVRIEESALKEREGETDRGSLQEGDFDWKAVRVCFDKGQEIEIRVSWIAKGCILLLLLGVIKRAY